MANFSGGEKQRDGTQFSGFFNGPTKHLDNPTVLASFSVSLLFDPMLPSRSTVKSCEGLGASAGCFVLNTFLGNVEVEKDG